MYLFFYPHLHSYRPIFPLPKFRFSPEHETILSTSCDLSVIMTQWIVDYKSFIGQLTLTQG